jgi:hypothetical protein
MDSLSDFEREITARYGSLPDHNVVDVNFDNDDRIFYMMESVLGKSKSVKIAKAANRNCRRCYGFGYVGALQPINPSRDGQTVLVMCSCLKKVGAKDDNMFGKEDETVLENKISVVEVNAKTALPQTKASRNFRDILPSGGMTKAKLHDHEIGTFDE